MLEIFSVLLIKSNKLRSMIPSVAMVLLREELERWNFSVSSSVNECLKDDGAECLLTGAHFGESEHVS